MAAMSDFLENKLIDHIFRGQNFTANGTLYVALSNTALSDTTTGSNIQYEPATANGYARVAITSNLTNWQSTQGDTAVSTGTTANTKNAGIIQFGSPTGNWGTISHFAVMDKDTGGNTYFWGALTTPKTVNSGDAAPSFAATALIVNLDN